ncbi:hypothetical protein DLM78_02170 [Leptospira stimsonii]|uniref:Uncharacterized protein n=1 Tax=Leptospira stimsonii TaxID=2202203 RepID=A0A8B3CVX2_9LEPT|nr:hypothetical protein DLM78_02170 [Leptospira stimsonii]
MRSLTQIQRLHILSPRKDTIRVILFKKSLRRIYISPFSNVMRTFKRLRPNHFQPTLCKM